MATVETTVLGGLLIEVDFSVYPAEPDVGIFSPYADDFKIVAVGGKPKKQKHLAWLYDRIEKAGEWETIAETANAEL